VVRDEAALQVFHLSLALIVMGVGFLKPNISTIVGRLYSKHGPRLDSGFTLVYAGINVGAMSASLVCAFLGETYGWRYGFGATGIGSEVLAAQLGKLASIERVEGQAIDMAQAGAAYGGLFEVMLWVGVGSGLAPLLITPLVKRWMHGIR